MGEMEGGTLILRVSVQVILTSCFVYSLFLLIQYNIQLILTPAPEKNLSTATAVAISAVVCSLVVFIAGTVCGVLLTVCISRWNKKRRSSKPAPNTQEQQQTVVVYEEVDTLKSQKIELEQNVAYGPVKPNQ